MYAHKNLFKIIAPIALAALLFVSNAVPAVASDPLVGVYYYPWWGRGSFPDGHSFDETLREHLIPGQGPVLGNYSNRNSDVIAAHIDQSHQGNIDVWVLSWWGPTSVEDVTIRDHILAHPRADELRYAIHYESQGRLGNFGNPDFSALTPDFRYLAQNYFDRSNYLHINGRPVVVMYLTRVYFNSQESRAAVANMRQVIQTEFGYDPYIVGDDFFGSGGLNLERAALWDAITNFDVYGTVLQGGGSTTSALNTLAQIYDDVKADAASIGVAFIPTASPGFNDKGVRAGHPAAPRYLDGNTGEDGSLFQNMLSDVVVPRVDAQADRLLLINSFNEWHEDTQIESSVTTPVTNVDDSGVQQFTEGKFYTGYGSLYLDILNSATVPKRLIPPAVIELPVVGIQLSSPFGEVLEVPFDATAVSLNVTAVGPTAAGFITVWPCGVGRPLASNVNYVAGDIVPNGVIATVGTEGSVCFFSQRETDLIVDIAGWFEGTAYTGATPIRLNDTRDGTGGILGPIESSNPMTIQVAGLQVPDANGVSTTVPSTIGAVALNVTVVQPESAGFVTVWPCDVTRPLSSNVNYVKNQIVANGVIAPVSAVGAVCLYSLVPTDIVVDLAGWFSEQSFTGTTPTRLVDTRDGTGGRSTAITSTDELSVPIHNITLIVAGESQQVPVTATAAAFNVTIVNPAKAGFVTVWPCSVSRPLASNLNFVPGQVVANNVIAPIGNDGSVCLYSNVETDVIVDIAGWFSTSGTGAFVGTTPERLVDTRDWTGPAPE